jgi:hypothetical protein
MQSIDDLANVITDLDPSEQQALLDKVVHRIGRQGYTADLSGHKVLKGYESQTNAPPKAPTEKSAGTYSPGDVVNQSGSPTPINAQMGAPIPGQSVAAASRT